MQVDHCFVSRLTVTVEENGNWTVSGQITGSSLADLLIGRVTTLEHGGPAIIPVDQRYIGLYAQDTWRAHPRLTLSYGLRWDYNPPPTASDGNGIPQVVNFDDFTKTTVRWKSLS